MHRALLPIALGMALNYAMMVVFHSLGLPDDQALLLVAVTATTCLFFCISALWIRWRPPEERWAAAIGSIFAIAVLANITLHYALTKQPHYTMQFALFSVAVGAVLISHRWLAICLAGSLVAWALCSLEFYDRSNWIEYGSYLVATAAVAVALNVARIRMVTRLEGTRFRAELRGEALRKAETDLREIIEKAPDGMVVHRGREIVYANPAFAASLRVGSHEELVGTSLTDYIHADDRNAASTHLLAASSNSAPATYTFLRHGGERVMLEVGTTRSLRFEGEPSVLIATRDVTARHKNLQAKLLLADRMSAVGTLAAGIAHEINNPLAVVMNNLNLMADEDRNDTSALVEQSLESAERVRLVVRGLKAFSQAESAEHELIDMRALLESAVQLARNEIRHRARLIMECANVPPVKGNAAHLGEALLNIIVNAAQSIEEENVEENTILLSCCVDLQGMVEVVVRDTGCGMSRETEEKIFDPFFTTKPIGVGTGLGLFFCHNVIVSELGGGIAVASEVDSGTTVRISLPPASEEDQRAAPPPTSTSIPPEDSKPRRVLIIDDEPQLCRSLLRLLESHEVSTVTSGQEGLEAVETASFDVILCDVMMPEMTGRQFYEALSERHSEMAQRVVFMTGGAFTAEANEFLKNLPNKVLDKPFDRAALMRVVAKASRRS